MKVYAIECSSRHADAWEAASLTASENSDLEERWDELDRLYRQAVDVLAGLDRLGLYQAGAHLSMALEAMRQRHPQLPRYD
jgi:hypothetical protein